MDFYNKPSPALFLMHYGVKGMKWVSGAHQKSWVISRSKWLKKPQNPV